MDTKTALVAFSAIAQETRLDVLRLLVRRGDIGALSGEIGAALDVRQNTMSANLGILHGAGLIRKSREGRAVRYFADIEGVQGLVGFLMEDCCGGRPELCRPVIAALVTSDGAQP